jgi:hypothetical protein
VPTLLLRLKSDIDLNAHHRAEFDQVLHGKCKTVIAKLDAGSLRALAFI